MEEIQQIINLLGSDYLDELDKEQIEAFKSRIGSDYYDSEDKRFYKYTKTDYDLDKSIKENRAFQKQIEKIKKEALLNVLKQKYQRYYSNIIDHSTPEELSKILPDIAELKKKEEECMDCKNSDYMFITISPEVSVGVFELIRLLEKITKLKFIKKYCYVLEQRFSGVPNEIYKEIGQGLHSHMFIDKGNYKPSHVRRDFSRVFNNIVVNIDYKFIKEQDVSKVAGYMIGEKKDDSKKEKQVQDRIWREKIGIKNFYGDLFNSLT